MGMNFYVIRTKAIMGIFTSAEMVLGLLRAGSINSYECVDSPFKAALLIKTQYPADILFMAGIEDARSVRFNQIYRMPIIDDGLYNEGEDIYE
ncbi:hypothetical protein [Enterocloster citroniae]